MSDLPSAADLDAVMAERDLRNRLCAHCSESRCNGGILHAPNLEHCRREFAHITVMARYLRERGIEVKWPQ